ncbi:MAG: anti-sigma factor [Thermomicrobiales bacterium]
MNDVHQNMDESYCLELMGVAAFGHLSIEEQAEFDGYLESNDDARTEYAELLAVVGLLPLALIESEPPAGLREKLAVAVGASQSERPGLRMLETGSQVPGQGELKSGNISWFAGRSARMLASAAAVILVAVTALTIGMNINDTEAESIDFAVIPDGVSGSLTYEPDAQKFDFSVEDMPKAPDGHVYQVWLIDISGVPVPVGVMFGTQFVVESDKAGLAAFAITLEPGPIGSESPTSDPIVVAPFES